MYPPLKMKNVQNGERKVAYHNFILKRNTMRFTEYSVKLVA